MQGLRPFVVGAPDEILIAALTLGLLLGVQRIWELQILYHRRSRPVKERHSVLRDSSNALGRSR